MDAVWAIIQDLIGIIETNQQLNSLIASRDINKLNSFISTMIENEFVIFIPQKDISEINSICFFN